MTVLSSTWAHDGLAADLASHLRAGGDRLTWCNIALGGPGDPRPDVYALRPFRYANPEAICYEVKVSVADFRSDVTSGKWQKYLAFSQGITFAVPQGLVTVADVPPGCGLIVRGERLWRHLRKPTLRTLELPLAAMCKLISARPTRTLSPSTASIEWSEGSYQRRQIEDRVTAHAMREIGQRFGQEIAQYLRAPEESRRIVQRAEEQAQKIIAKAKTEADYVRNDGQALLRELAGLYGLDDTVGIWDLKLAMRKRAAFLASDDATARLLLILQHCRDFLDEGIQTAGIGQDGAA